MNTRLIRVLALSSIAVLCILCPLTIVRPAGATPPSGYTLDWSDDFQSTSLDPNKWGYRLLGQKRHDGYNVTDAVSLDGEYLTITTYTDPTTGHHNTGMISTDGKYMPRYGYVEARIEFDGSRGMWSSFWMQSDSMSHPDPYDPHFYGTEIDIVEHRSVDGPGNDISNQGTSSLLWDGYAPSSLGAKAAGGDLHGASLASGFHTYGLEWTPTYEKYYYDGIVVWTVINSTLQDPPHPAGCAYPPCTPDPSQSPSVFGPVSARNEYFILSSEVWNSPSNLTATPPDYGWCGPTPASFPSGTKMIVDYVKHYTAVSKVVDLCAVGSASTTMQVSWTAPADRMMPLAQYDLRYSTLPIVDGGASQGQANFNTATSIPTLAPHSQGSAELKQVTGLSTCTTYYFALKTQDGAGNWSLMSNVSGGTTQGCGHSVSGLGRTEQVADIIQCGGGAAPAPVKIDESSPSFSAPSPNPARGTTSFQISVPAKFQGATLRVDVFDVAGRRVRSLVDRTASQGQAQVDWNLLDDSGRRVASGLYRVRVGIGDTRKTFPLLVLR
jgi:beta-glucanase (GH16 family)